MEIFTAIVTAIVSICGTLGISKFFRTREEKNNSQITNNQLSIDIMQDVLKTTQDTLKESQENLKKSQDGLRDQHKIIIKQALELKTLAIKVTELELLYCSTKDFRERRNLYRNCFECPESETCTLKEIKCDQDKKDYQNHLEETEEI